MCIICFFHNTFLKILKKKNTHFPSLNNPVSMNMKTLFISNRQDTSLLHSKVHFVCKHTSTLFTSDVCKMARHIGSLWCHKIILMQRQGEYRETFPPSADENEIGLLVSNSAYTLFTVKVKNTSKATRKTHFWVKDEFKAAKTF